MQMERVNQERAQQQNAQAAAEGTPHDLILEGRKNLTVTGVRRVIHCEPESAAIETGCGVLYLSGAQLSVTALDLDLGEAKLSGRIDAMEYTETRTPGGFFRRLVR